MKKFEICPVAECSILIKLGDHIAPERAPCIAYIANQIRDRHADVIMNVTPSFTTILVDYLPFLISEQQMVESVHSITGNAIESCAAFPGRDIELPVFYHPSVAPDLTRLTEKNDLSVDEIISLHTSQPFTVCAIGFAPGFAFMAELPESLQLPRLFAPRASVPAGSVGIAGPQTAVYPLESPGGWNIIGNCPVPLYRPESDVISPFEVGDRVTFVAIDEEEYLSLGGKVWEQ